MESEDIRARISGVGRLGWGVAFSVLAVLGNYVALSIGFNVDFIFGSVFGLMAVVLLGPIPGVLVSLIGASYSIVLWNHPYAIIIFGCEALWLALVRRKFRFSSIVFIDLAYWLLVGVPLVFTFYLGVMDLGLTNTGIIALKQSLNGLCNAVLASIALSYLPFWKWLRLPERPIRTYAQILFEAIAFLLMVACIGELIYMNQREMDSQREALANRVLQSEKEAAWVFEDWFEQRVRATQVIAREGDEAGIVPSEELQGELLDILNMFPDFHNVYVADASATTVAFVPPVNERGEPTIGLNFSDREYFHRIMLEKRAVVSDVFMGRGGVFKPIFAIVAPIIRDDEVAGFGLGAVNLDRLEHRFGELAEQSRVTITLVDRQGHVAVSTEAGRQPLEEFTLRPAEEELKLVEGVNLSLPVSGSALPNVGRWQEAVLFARIPIEAAGWEIIVEGPLAPIQKSIHDSTMLNIAAIFVLLLVTSGVSLWVSRGLSIPLQRLSAVSTDIPEKIESGTEIDWPNSNSLEVRSLISNFEETADELRQKVQALKAYGAELEAAVADRTSELQASEARLKEAQRIARVGSWELDPTTYSIELSDETCSILEIDPERFEGSSEDLRKAVFPGDWKAVNTAYLHSVARQTPFEMRHRMLLPDGRVKWVQARCVTIYGEDGTPLRSLGTIQDIDEQVAYEQKLDTFAQSQRVLLKEVNHRVKNNLAMITSLLKLEVKDRCNLPCKEHMLHIVNRVDALSAVHSMLSSVEWRPINLRQVCLHVLSGVLANDPRTRIEVSPSDVVIDASQAHNIALVLNELATNTAKHATQGDQLVVSVQIAETDDGMVVIRYLDNGPGYRGELDDPEPSGPGIGMQLIKGIVEMSLYGSVSFATDNGAVTEIRFRPEGRAESSNG